LTVGPWTPCACRRRLPAVGASARPSSTPRCVPLIRLGKDKSKLYSYNALAGFLPSLSLLPNSVGKLLEHPLLDGVPKQGAVRGRRMLPDGFHLVLPQVFHDCHERAERLVVQQNGEDSGGSYESQNSSRAAGQSNTKAAAELRGRQVQAALHVATTCEHLLCHFRKTWAFYMQATVVLLA